jgi:hypothetical protein
MSDPRFIDGRTRDGKLDVVKGKKRLVGRACALLLATLVYPRSARSEVNLAEAGGWKITTDGRVNAFVSVARGTGVPDQQPDFPGTITEDTEDTQDNIASTRIRNGFIMSILGFNARQRVSESLEVSARVGLWMNTSSSRTKNAPGLVDPRELYGRLEGPWGRFQGGSDLALFGRGGMLVDADIAHDYGMGYPCLIENASGGACGMAAFGAIFSGFEPGIVYTTPDFAGLELSVGLYDPANIANGDLNRSPLPRVEGEVSFRPGALRVFASGFWQQMEGTVPDPTGMPGAETDLHADAWGAQAGVMVTLGPAMLGGAAFTGAGLSPITHVDEHQTAADRSGTLRKSRGVFGLAALVVDSIHTKFAAGAGILRVDKSPNDPAPVGPTGAPQNPQLLKQNVGFTAGIYQTTGPVIFALEYFRAEHTLYEYGQVNPVDPSFVDIKSPAQAVNFFNAGFTVVW